MHLIGNEEQRLAKRLQDGEKAAAREFCALYADYLAGVCSRYITDEEDLKDVFQDAFIHILSHIQDFQYRGTGSLQAWATKVVVNESLKFLLAKKRNEQVAIDIEIIDEPAEAEPPNSDIPPDVVHQMVRLPYGAEPLCFRRQEPPGDSPSARHYGKHLILAAEQSQAPARQND